MQKILHETCPQYVVRRLSEGWQIVKQQGFLIILQSPEGIIRPVDLRNDVETLRPDAAGDETNLTVVGDTNNYAMVDEAEADDNTTHVMAYNKDTYQRDLYSMANHSVGSGTINKITLYFRVTTGNSDARVKGAIKSNSTPTETAVKDPYVDFGDGEWGTYNQEWAVNPADSQVWEWADIDALQIGVACKSPGYTSSMKCTQVYVEVDYALILVPTITTQAASAIEETTATGNGNITDTGGENCGERGVEWGTSPGSYPNSHTDTDSFGTGAFTKGMTSLPPGTLIYYRAKAHNSAGWGYGAEESFTTKPNPPTSLAATTVTYSRIDLTWTKGSGAERTMVRRKTGSYPTGPTDGAQAYFDTGNSFNNTGLDPDTTYFYRAWSYKTGAPNSGYSDEYSSDSATTYKLLQPSGIASAEAFGIPAVGVQFISPSSIASAEAFGTAVVAGPIIAVGIPSAEAFGVAKLNLILAPLAIVSAEAFGTAKFNFRLFTVSIPTAEAFGTAVVAGPIIVVGIASKEAFGSALLTPSYAPATYYVKIDWDNDGDFEDADEDITADVETIANLERGKNEELGQALAATVELKLKNTNGKYSPVNTSSPLYGNLKPRRRVRIHVTGTVVKDLFNGYIADIVPHPHRKEQSAYIYCVDGLDVLQQAEVTTPLFENKKTGALITEILALADWSEGTSWILDISELGVDTYLGFTPTNIDEGQDTIPYAWWHHVKARPAIREVETSGLGFFYLNGAGEACYEDRFHRLKGPHKVSQAIIDNTMTDIRFKIRDKDIRNEIFATFIPRNVGSLGEIWRLRDTPGIAAGETHSVEAEFSYPSKDVVDLIATTDYTANTNAEGTGEDKTGDISISTTVFGQSCRLEITNNASVIVFMTLLRIRGKSVTEQEKITRYAYDTASQKEYQKRTHRLEGKWVASSSIAQDFCNFAKSRLKEPQPVIVVDLHGGSDDYNALLFEILSRDLSDRVTIKSTKLGLDDDFFINKVKHRIDFKGGYQHAAQWTLGLASEEEYWVLDTSELGLNTRLAY